jgi:sulfur-carrier protein
MPTIQIPYPLRPYVAGQAEVLVEGETVGSAMDDLMKHFPAFKTQLYKQDGSLRAFVNLYIGKENIKTLKGLDTPLSADDIVKLVPSIAGG